MPPSTHDQPAPATKGRTIRSWASFYDAVAWLASFGRLSDMRRETLSVVDLQSGESVLDVGCGTGSLTRLAAGKVAPSGRVAGIDASPEMIATARRKAAKHAPAIDFRVAPIEQLPFGAGEFDVVLCSLMLHHLPDDVKALGLSEVLRVLKSGGRLVAVDLEGTSELVGHLIGHRMPGDYPQRLQAMVLAAGFVGVERIETKYRQLVFLRATAPGQVE